VGGCWHRERKRGKAGSLLNLPCFSRFFGVYWSLDGLLESL